MPLFLLIFILVPLAEIAVFIWVGDAIGIGPTILIVIITAIIGTMLLRSQGFSTMERAQKTLKEGGIPMDSVVDGAALLVAGAFLLTPGIITDTFGFLLFVPAFRHGLAKLIFKRFMGKANIDVNIFGNGPKAKPGNFDQSAPRDDPFQPRTEQPFKKPGKNPFSGKSNSDPRKGAYDDGKGPIIDAEYERVKKPDDGSNNDS